jgi:hypothetical protein
MAFTSGASRTRTRRPSEGLTVPLYPAEEWDEPEKPRRDWTKIVLIVGLASLSWVATYVGMLELIQSNMGSLPIIHKVIIGFSVAMLMTMIVWLLDQLFAPLDWFTKGAYVGGYLFLTIISIGFGFGFYWKVLESRSEAARSAESAVGQVQSSLHAASTRLEQLQTTLVQLSTISTKKAELERTKGTSCPNSSPGDGPRRKMRDEDAERFLFASNFVKGRVGVVKSDMAALDGELAKIVSNDPSIVDPNSGTRNEFMRSLGRRLDLTVTGFNAFRTDPQLRQIRADLADRAERTTVPNGRGRTILCPDPQLQHTLRGVVRAIDQLPNLEKPKIAAVEGSEATIEAFRRLSATLFGLLSFELPLSAEELRHLQQKAVQSVENPASLRALANETVGLSQRDYIPLGIAFFVDLCLLLVSISRPMNRFVATRESMIAAERGPVFPILSRFNEIHNHELRRTFDVFREVIFESGGTYYVAVPLNAPRDFPQREQLRLDAQTLANLCYALEGQGVLTRPWKLTPSLVAQRKLRRQGSKFIECYRDQRMAPFPRAWRRLKGLFLSDHNEDETPAFRIYAFKSGAWPELILGAVMGAAGRIEAERRHAQPTAETVETAETVQTVETATRHDAKQTDGIELTERNLEPVPETTRLRDVMNGAERHMKHETANGKYDIDLPQTAQGRFDHRPRKPIDPALRERFGSYAPQAEAELATYRDLDEEAYNEPDAEIEPAANGNAMPADAARLDEQRSSDIIVPFPAPHSSTKSPVKECLADGITTTIETLQQQHAKSDNAPVTIGIELRRETATFHVPISQASLPDALTSLAETIRVRGQVASEQPQLELTLSAPTHASNGAQSRDPTVDGLNFVDEPAEFEPPLILRKTME